MDVYLIGSSNKPNKNLYANVMYSNPTKKGEPSHFLCIYALIIGLFGNLENKKRDIKQNEMALHHI